MPELGSGTSFYAIFFIATALLATIIVVGLGGLAYLLIKQSKEKSEISIDKNINLTVNLTSLPQASTAETIQEFFNSITTDEVRRSSNDRVDPLFLTRKAPLMLERLPIENASDFLIENGKLAKSERSMIVRPPEIVPQRLMGQQKSPTLQRVRIVDRAATPPIPYSHAVNAYLKQMLSNRKIRRIISLKA